MLNRIKQQAKVLSIINEFTKDKRELAGLSRSAIKDWMVRNVDIGELSEIQLVLEAISNKIGCLNDYSNPPIDDLTCDIVDDFLDVIRELMVKKTICLT